MRKLISSGSAFEPRIGFSRAVRIGQLVAVAGTAPIAHGGGVACMGDVYGQTRRCLEIVAEAIAEAGLSLDAVIRTRVMLTDISQWEAAAGAVRLGMDPRTYARVVRLRRERNPRRL